MHDLEHVYCVWKVFFFIFLGHKRQPIQDLSTLEIYFLCLQDSQRKTNDTALYFTVRILKQLLKGVEHSNLNNQDEVVSYLPKLKAVAYYKFRH